MTIGEFEAKARAAAEEVNAFAAKHALAGRAQADHFCYKCGSTQEFEAVRAMLEPHAGYLHQTFISGRRIAYVRLTRSVDTAIGAANFLELSDQKPDGSQRGGFDHVELYPTAGTYEELVSLFETAGEKVIKVERPHHTTHDIKLASGFIIRLCHEPLIEKIKREEMK